MGWDKELEEYRKLIGTKEYKKQYIELYYSTRSNKRYSGLEYENDENKINFIKEKYKNGVSKETIELMVKGIVLTEPSKIKVKVKKDRHRENYFKEYWKKHKRNKE